MKHFAKLTATLGRHVARLAAVLTLGISATVIVGATPAQAERVGPPIIHSAQTGECLDDSFTYGLRTVPCNGSDYQKWIQYDIHNGVFRLQNKHTGECLDDSNSYGLRTVPCNGTDYQVWHSGNGKYQMITFINLFTDRCLDYSAAYGLRSFPCNGTWYQTWY